MHKWFIVLLVWSVCPCLVYGQDTELKSVKGKAAIREYEKTTEELTKEYMKKLEDLDKEFRMKSELVKARLITNLNEALTEEARKVNLPEANKIDTEIKRHKAMPLPNLVEAVGAANKDSKDRAVADTEMSIKKKLGGRTTWINTTYISTIRLVELDKWEERYDQTGKLALTYKTVNVTDEYVELYTEDGDGKKMRLYRDHMKFLKDGKWERLANGSWKPAIRKR